MEYRTLETLLASKEHATCGYEVIDCYEALLLWGEGAKVEVATTKVEQVSTKMVYLELREKKFLFVVDANSNADKKALKILGQR